MKKLIVVFFVLATVLVGCKDEDEKLDVNQTEITVGVGKEFQINVRSVGQDGGYRWVRVQNQASIVDSVNFDYITDNDGRNSYGEMICGAPGTYIWYFKANKIGTEVVKFYCAQSFTPNSMIATKEVVVRVE